MARWLYSVIWAIIWTCLYMLLMRRGMYWWMALSACMTASYSLVLWRTLVLLFGRRQYQPTIIYQAHAPRLVRRVILEEEVPWERS